MLLHKQWRCRGAYLIDEVVHQQVMLDDSSRELFIMHHVLKPQRIQRKQYVWSCLYIKLPTKCLFMTCY